MHPRLHQLSKGYLTNLLVGTLWLLAVCPSFSQDINQLEQIVITGTRTEQILMDSPVRIELIPREQLEIHHVRNAKEAIELLPGALIQDIHGKTGQEVWLQGMSSDRVLVLIDGEPVSASTGSSTDLTQIGTANIERIEVVKGATSALYGSNAIGGVVNIITRQSIAPFSYSFRGDIGSFGDQNLDGNAASHAKRSAAGQVSFSDSQWYGEANFDVVESDGFRAYEHPWNQSGPETYKANGRAKLEYSPTESLSFFASGNYYDEDSKYLYTDEKPGSDIYKVKTELAERTTWRTGANWWLENWGDIQLRYFDETFTNSTTQDATSTPFIEQSRVAESNTKKFSSQWDMDLTDSQVLTLGLDHSEETLEQSTIQNTTPDKSDKSSELSQPTAGRHGTEFFLQDDIKLTNTLRLLPGFRYQDDSDFGTYFAPKINGRLDLPGTKEFSQFVRFGWGQGYRVPNLKERFFEFDHSQNGYVVKGNRQLQPEQSNSIQLGWVLTKSGAFSVDINFFHNKLKDAIETALAAPAAIENDFVAQYLYVNVGRAQTRGGELNASFVLSETINWKFAYTYLESEDLTTGNHLAKRPRHQVKTNIDIKPFQGKFTLSLFGQWQSSSWYDLENQNRSPGWQSFNLKVNYQYHPRIKLYAGIDNFTNTQKDFTDSFDLRPSEGRFAYIGLQFFNN